jgi:chromosome segregation ATPase
METLSIDQFREELQSWKHELSAIKEEIRSFESTLERLSSNSLPKNTMAQIEHFQNGFIRQKEVIDELRHDLPDSRTKVDSIFLNLRSTSEEENWESATENLENRMNTFRKIYTDLKLDFHHFESDWM